MVLTNSRSLRRRIVVYGILLFAMCLVLVGSPASQGENTSPLTVRHISLTRGFDAGTEILFTIVQQDDAFRWIATEFNSLDPPDFHQWTVPLLPYIDQAPLYASFGDTSEVHTLLVDSQLNVDVIKLRRERDGSTAVIGPTRLHSLGDPDTYGHPTSIAVIPRPQNPPQNPIDPWVAVGTNTGNVILAKSGVVPCVLPVGGPVVDLADVPQVVYFAFVALVNRRDGQHLVGIIPPPDDGVSEQIVFDLLASPPPDDGFVDLASFPPPDDGMPLPEPTEVNLIGADGTRSIKRLTIPAVPTIGGSFSIEPVGDLPVSICWVEAGAFLPIDGSGVLHDPIFDMNHGGISKPLFTVFGNSMELFPQALYLGSDGQYITAVIESAGSKAADIVIPTIRLEVNGASLRLSNNFTPQLGDADLDGNPDLTVKFNRKTFQAQLPRGASSVLATARWIFADDTVGFASSEIRVIP